jgi:hypothetical protein
MLSEIISMRLDELLSITGNKFYTRDRSKKNWKEPVIHDKIISLGGFYRNFQWIIKHF